MPLLSAFVLAVLLTGGAPGASGHVSVRGEPAPLSNDSPDYLVGPVTSKGIDSAVSSDFKLALAGELPTTSPTSSPSATRPTLFANVDWKSFCGTQPHRPCAVVYVSAAALLLLLFTTLCACCLVRWWRCKSNGLHAWRRLDTISDDDGNAYGRYTVTIAEREGLLAAEHAVPSSTGEADHSQEEEAEGEREDEATTRGRFARYLHRLNLHGTRLWTVLRMTPAGLLYGGTRSSSQPASTARHAASAPPGDADGPLSREDHVRGDDRDSSDAATTGVLTEAERRRRPFLRGVVSVATTTADSSESGNDAAAQSEDSDAAPHDGDARHFLCAQECLEAVEAVEGECGVRRSAATVAALLVPRSPITPHILPQLFDYTAGSTSAHDDGEGGESGGGGGGGFADGSDSDSQRMRHPDSKTAHTSTSSLTASANSSTHHTPSFLTRDAAAAVPHADSNESVLYYNESERDLSEQHSGNSTGRRMGFPHVETAIFDTAANTCMATEEATVAAIAAALPTSDLSVVNNLFEPDHFPSSTHPASETAASSVMSHVSALDCYIPPPATSGTATPASLRDGSGTNLPLPLTASNTNGAVSTRHSSSAALPVSNSLNDGLDMEGEEVVEVRDAPPQSRSYVPATQQYHQQQYLQQQQQQAQQQVAKATPPPPEEPVVKPRRKRAISQYSEPWQPILVPRSSPQLAAAAAVTALPTAAPVPTPIAAPPSPREAPRPPRTPLSQLNSALEDELDDLMLDDDESAQSNQTGESGHIFSGSSTSTSRTVTPATENDPESAIGTPTVFCAAAMANGSNSSVNGIHHNNMGGAGQIGFVTVCPPASASIPLRPEAPPLAVFARTAVVNGGNTLLGGYDGASQSRTPPWSSCSVGRRPLNLSVEERTLLMKSRKWLFPLIDGVDEIESSGVDESPRSNVNESPKADITEEEVEEEVEDAVEEPISDGIES